MKKKTGMQKEYLTEKLKLPRDMILGEFKLSMTGNRELFLENYRGISEYTDACILIQTKTGYLRIEGRELKIEYYTNEDMKITGVFRSILFDKELVD